MVFGGHLSGDLLLEKEQMKRLKEDLIRKYRSSMKTFSPDQEQGDETVDSSPGSSGSQEYLRLFSFICALGFDVYLKKQMMEYLIDYIREEYPAKGKKEIAQRLFLFVSATGWRTHPPAAAVLPQSPGWCPCGP